jgi:NAD(P)H dehydrogenase (quinone)
MNHLIVFAHPHQESFNHAILQSAIHALESKGNTVVVRDLYALGFNPVLSQEDFQAFEKGHMPDDIAQEQRYISESDTITLIYPVWWTGMPAILKGYIDRVFAHGFAYRFNEEGTIDALLGDKKGFMITTFGTPSSTYEGSGMIGSLKQTSDEGIFGFCGIQQCGHLFFGTVHCVDDAARKTMIQTVEQTLRELF